MSHPVGRHTLRELTETEVRVLQALLAEDREGERVRLARTGLARSTYHAARRRAYEEGWIRDRYLPDPVAFDYGWARLLLARPYADRQEELVRRLSGNEGTVVLWQSPQSLFCVSLERGGPPPAPSRSSSVPEGSAQELTELQVDLKGRGLPVYFDYEGLLAHLGEQTGTVSYPRSLSLSGRPGAPRVPVVRSPSVWNAAYQLVSSPRNAEERGRPSHRLGPPSLPRSQRKLLELGCVRRRVLPDPARLPPFHGRRADELVFVHGVWRGASKGETLLRTLTAECRVYPFLYAFTDERLLLAALGQTPGVGEGELAGPSRRPVLPTLRQCLENIVVTRERVESILARVDHRYDPLLRSGPPREAPARASN